MKKQKLQKGDEVKIIRGKEKGKTGKIEKVFSKNNEVIVDGLNTYKRHVKARTQTEKSEIKTIVKPVSLSNVMFVCPKCHTAARIGYRIEGAEKVRIYKKCEQEV